MIVKNNNSSNIIISCFTKFIKDNQVRVSTKLNLPFNDTQRITDCISESIEKHMGRR